MKKIILTILCSSFLLLNNVSANESEISKSVSEFIKLQSQDINEDVFEVTDCTNITHGSGTSLKASWDKTKNYSDGYLNYLGLYANKNVTCTNMPEEDYLTILNTSFNLSEEEQKNYSLKVYHRNLYRGEKSEYLTIDNEHLMLSKLGYCYYQAKTVDFLRFCLYDFAKKGEYYFGWNINRNNENQSFYNQYESWVKNENKLNEYFKKVDELMPKLYSKLKNDSNKIADLSDKLKVKIDSTYNKNNKRILEYIRNKTLEYLITNNDYNFFVNRYDLEIRGKNFLEKANYEIKNGYPPTVMVFELTEEDKEDIVRVSEILYDLNLVATNNGGYPDIHSIFKDSKYYKHYSRILRLHYELMQKEKRIDDYDMRIPNALRIKLKNAFEKGYNKPKDFTEEEIKEIMEISKKFLEHRTEHCIDYNLYQLIHKYSDYLFISQYNLEISDDLKVKIDSISSNGGYIDLVDLTDENIKEITKVSKILISIDNNLNMDSVLEYKGFTIKFEDLIDHSLYFRIIYVNDKKGYYIPNN